MKNIFGEINPPTENPPAREISELEKLVAPYNIILNIILPPHFYMENANNIVQINPGKGIDK
jgi:hypothetical protein